MSYFEKTFLPEIIKRKERKERGEYNGIPLPFTVYRNYIDSIEKGVYYGLLSGTGNGKSYWARYTFIYEPLEFCRQTGYKAKFLYFALEDSALQIYKKLVAHYLWVRHSVILSQKLLDSRTEPLPDKYLKLLQSDVEFYEMFEDYVHIFNDDLDPDSILQRCEEMKEKYGDEYHYVVIIDNYANITQGSYINTYSAIEILSREHIRLNLCKKLGFSVLAIMQADQDTEKYAARNASGGSITAIEPNLGSIGKIKIINQDMHVIWALFNPWRYGLLVYPNSKGYSIDTLRNKFRSLIMLKNNFEEMAPRLPLYFEGSKGIFSELPALSEEEELQRLYVSILENEKKFKESRSNQKY